MSTVHQGHRARMRERYLQNGAHSLATHELLELLLFYAIPRKDTNPTAHELLAHFGSAEALFNATKEELSLVPGIGERVADFLVKNLHAARAVTSAPLWEAPPPVYNSYSDLGAFFVSYFEKAPAQATVAMLLDAGMHALTLMELAPLDYDSAGVRAEKAISRAIACGATIVVLAHNHPYGPAYPTHGDIVSSQVIEKDFSDCGILLLEHYVISGKDFVGFHHRFGRAEESLGDAVCTFIRSKEEAARL